MGCQRNDNVEESPLGRQYPINTATAAEPQAARLTIIVADSLYF